MNFDLTTFAGISTAVLAATSAIKAGWPSWADGKEGRVALVLGVALGIVARLVHPSGFSPGLEGWVAALLHGFGAGITAQVAHDKALNVIAGKTKDEPKPEEK